MEAKDLTQKVVDSLDLSKNAGSVARQAGKEVLQGGRKAGGKLSDLIDMIFELFE